MPHTPSLCGNFLTNKRSLVAFTWSLTSALTLAAFCLAIVFTAHVHGHYRRMERYYEDLLEYNQAQREYYKEQQNDDEDNDYGHSSDDRVIEAQLLLGTVGSKSMAAVAAYTAVLAVGLVFYGSTTIVGFTSMRGVYIAPCFSLTDPFPTLKLGMFGGCIILFANLLLVCAIVLGEVRVEDWTDWGGDGDDNQNDDNVNQHGGSMNEPYEIERIATILAVTCMFLAPLYIIFAVLLFFYFGDERMLADDVVDFTTNPNYYEMDETTGKGPTTMEFATMNNSNNNHHYHHPHLGGGTRESTPSFGAPGIDVGRVGSQPGALSLPGTTIQTSGAPSAGLANPAPAAASVTSRQ